METPHIEKLNLHNNTPTENTEDEAKVEATTLRLAGEYPHLVTVEIVDLVWAETGYNAGDCRRLAFTLLAGDPAPEK